MRVLLTGSTGFLGSHLLRELTQHHDVLSLYRTRLPQAGTPVKGDVTEFTNLGIAREVDLSRIDLVIHSAAIIDLSDNNQAKKQQLWETNVEGSRNVLVFCHEHRIPRLFYVSTAYTKGRNTYERSKAKVEAEIAMLTPVIAGDVPGFTATVFKPSIIVGNSGTHETLGAAGFYDVVRVLSGVHRRAEVLRRKLEGTLHLPSLDIPTVRLPGDPQHLLNLVPVDWVAHIIARQVDVDSQSSPSRGPDGVTTLYLTHQGPPSLAELTSWISETIYLDFRIQPASTFTPSLPERLVTRMMRPFLPYLQMDAPFPCGFTGADAPPVITKEFIQRSIEVDLLGMRVLAHWTPACQSATRRRCPHGVA